MERVWFKADEHRRFRESAIVRVRYANGIEQVGYLSDFHFHPDRFNPIKEFSSEPDKDGCFTNPVKEAAPSSLKTPPPLTTFADYFAACARRYMSTQDATWLQRINSLANGLEDLLK